MLSKLGINNTMKAVADAATSKAVQDDVGLRVSQSDEDLELADARPENSLLWRQYLCLDAALKATPHDLIKAASEENKLTNEEMPDSTMVSPTPFRKHTVVIGNAQIPYCTLSTECLFSLTCT